MPLYVERVPCCFEKNSNFFELFHFWYVFRNIPFSHRRILIIKQIFVSVNIFNVKNMHKYSMWNLFHICFFCKFCTIMLSFPFVTIRLL